MEKILFHSDSAEKTIETGKKIAEYLTPKSSLIFKGGMGAGKTHLTKGIAEYFGAGDVVSSPTFALVNQYEGENVNIYHFDLFRISSLDDLYAIGFFDYLLDDKGIIIIEWSENIPELPSYLEKYITVTITPTGDNEREIELEL